MTTTAHLGTSQVQPRPENRPRRRWSRWVAFVLAVLLVITIVVIAVGRTSRVQGDPTSPAGTVFGPASAWRQDVSAVSLAGNSSALVSNLARQVAAGHGPAALNLHRFNTTFYSVPGNTRRADVKFDDCQRKGLVPGVLYDKSRGAYFRQVPIPSDAVQSPGTDGQLTVWSKSSDQLWELWKANKRSDGWHACWGGRIDHVSTNPGFFPDRTGSAATSLPYAAGMIGIREMQAGRIEHAMALQLKKADNWKVFSYPAQRSDGYNPRHKANEIPEGLRFRLDPSVDVDRLAISPVAKIIARAAQTYGFIVTDRAGVVALSAESGTPVERRTGTDPWDKLLHGTRSYEVLAGFPWDKLQALPKDYGKP